MASIVSNGNDRLRKGNLPRRTWQTVNELTSRKSNTCSVKELTVDGVSITNPTDLSDTFNEHFSTIGPKLANEIPSAANSNNRCLDYLNFTDQRFYFDQINCNEVFLLLNKLSQSKSTGLDKISARLIRECADLICIPICAIFNRSLITGVFPDEWKCAKVTPLFKQGSSNDMNNYRPISVISVVAKVFERITYDQLYNYLSQHDIFSKNQSGFRPLHSTVTALLEAADSWAYNIDRGNVNAVIFLDLKKAFDTVDHAILLSKLSAYGIQGDAYNWFKSYLENRTQKCSVNGSLSKTCSLQCGIPQGTILGPLLFLLYINDLPNCLSNSYPRMYADDTHLTYADSNMNAIQSCLNEDLQNISEWLIANKLTLNMTKTEFMLIGSRQKLSTITDTPILTINGTPINQVSTTKSLGILIDSNLTWGNHIDKLAKKIASGIAAVKRVRPFVPSATLHLIYKALIQPHFDYCNVVWGNCSMKLADKLQKLQNRAARTLTFSNYDTDAAQLFERLNWENLSTQHDIQKAIMVFKSLNNLAPEYLCSKFINRSMTTPYTFRDSENKLAIPLPRTNYLRNSFSYSGAVLWNSLPQNVRQAESLNNLKTLLKKHYRNK